MTFFLPKRRELEQILPKSDMDNNEEIKLLLLQEQTLLSRERTMHSYMQTGLAFASVGLLTMKFLAGLFYFGVGILFIILGGL
jgi:hypothetical protein